jgi:hypothetical protein
MYTIPDLQKPEISRHSIVLGFAYSLTKVTFRYKPHNQS